MRIVVKKAIKAKSVFTTSAFLSKNYKVKPLNFSNCYCYSSAKVASQFSQKFTSGKYYQVLGFASDRKPNEIKDDQLKRQYLGMVKKYHSDGVTDPVQKLQNEQITKCIITAYDFISTERVKDKIKSGIYQKIYQDQDEIAMKIYGKKFDQIKYELFKQGNWAKRNQFMEQLQKIKKDSKNYNAGVSSSGSNFSYDNSDNQRMKTMKIKTPQGSNTTIPLIVALAGGVILLGLFYQNKNSQVTKSSKAKSESSTALTKQKIKQIETKTLDANMNRFQQLVDSFTQQMPPMLKFPQETDPHIVDQLITYSIAPDINLFEVNHEVLSQKQQLQKLMAAHKIQDVQDLKIHPIKKAKLNSTLSLALQAERCLQNVYVKVRDVVDQIQNTGKFTPPAVFFKFYGYIMFQIRQKPLSLQNYRNTDYISLFDLFFDYYSPIPFKRNEWNQYLVGFNDDNLKLFGNVHLNNRPIPCRYLQKGQKVVVMREIPKIPSDQQKYINIWQDFYRKYEAVWRRSEAKRF